MDKYSGREGSVAHSDPSPNQGLMEGNYSQSLSLGLWRSRQESRQISTTKSRIPSSRMRIPLRNSSRESNYGGRKWGGTWWRVWWSWLFLACLLSTVFCPVEACGPGRGTGRRRAPRKLTPLVYKQHFPNVPENALSAAGLSEGRILRGDTQRFKELVPNYNPDIVFRDDEGTGADRLMTQKLREKLNTLAISVMNQWPGVKLRVIEGWDEEQFHSPNSLHYEGRAVDIQTSDQDWSKYGMLARLAVESGFDWVYYESRAHIHCSVKSDSFQGGRAGGCFSGNSTVMTPFGRRKISEINVGDSVLTMDSSGNPIFSSVLLFLDRNSTEVREFYEIKTSKTTLRLTPSHLLFILPAPLPREALDSNSYFSTFLPPQFNSVGNEELMIEAEITFARNIAIGDMILTLDPKNSKILTRDSVLDVRSIVGEGVYAPLTSTGTIIVDGVVSSCYAVVESQSLAHWSFLPIRLLHNLMEGLSQAWRRVNLLVSLGLSSPGDGNVVKILSQESPDSVSGKSNEDDGVFWYASFLYSLTSRVLPSSLLYPYS